MSEQPGFRAEDFDYDLPPELIAQKMMQGLDQYTAMKTMQMQQGSYAAF